ncbi:MAG: translation initiation factor IF-2 [Candidatus Omnitrophica bacterium]|jgi:translation initiation factor IF-2|nr:translation initiation factor IF-2 [Candidatus Omnitrophota bacterium]
MRIYQEAKKLNVSPKNLIDICNQIGIKGKTSVSGLTQEEIQNIENNIKKIQRAKEKIIITGAETVGDIASKMALHASEIIKSLKDLNISAGINEKVGLDNIQILCESLEFPYTIQKTKETYSSGKYIDSSSDLQRRAPIVTIMGHVDHGKTTILDTIRKTNIAQKEYGQITQKIGAYKVQVDSGSIIFIDTPGHEAFSAMRARGASVTDIVVLVVAADDGVKMQTIEAIDHCKAANVPIIVAINKIDKPNVNPEIVKKQLSEYGIIPEEWGGQNVFINVSGLTGQNIKELLEIILIMGEMMDLKTNPNRPAEGTVLESYLHKQKGSVIDLIVQNGTLNVGDYFVSGDSYGKVRAMIDEFGKRIDKVCATIPVEALGAHHPCQPGERFFVVLSESEAKEKANSLKTEKSLNPLSGKKLTLEELQKQIVEGQVNEVKIILKTDSNGSKEAIIGALEKLSAQIQNQIKAKLVIVHSGLGTTNESDILLAVSSDAIIFGFNISVDNNIEKMSKQYGIEIKTYKIIYDLIEDIKATMEGKVKPVEVLSLAGQASIKKIFKVGKNQAVAGCLVVEGKIIRNSKAKIIREGKIIFEGQISNLKRFKDNVKEVGINTECGISIENFNDLKEGDIIQSYISTIP